MSGPYRRNRYKTGNEHRVPLSNQAMAVLEAAKVFDDGSGYIFPSPAGRAGGLSENTLMKAWRKLEMGGVVHGFRSSWRVWGHGSCGRVLVSRRVRAGPCCRRGSWRVREIGHARTTTADHGSVGGLLPA